MDVPIGLNNCGVATENTVDATHDLVKADESDQKSKEDDSNVKDGNLPHTSVPLDAIDDRSCKQLNKEPELAGDENVIEKKSHQCKLNQIPGNASGASAMGQAPKIADQITTEESSAMTIDEQLLKPSSDAQVITVADQIITEESSNSLTDEQHSKPGSDDQVPKVADQITSSMIIIDEQYSKSSSDVNPNSPITPVKTEKEADPNKSSSLALLAQYDTENDSDDDVREVPDAQTYQNRCVEIDSDSSTSDVEFLSENRNDINLDMFDIDNGDDDEEEEGNIRTSRQPKVKGELQLEDLPPIEDLHITVPEEECTELGKIHSIVEQLVLVNALPGTVPLDLETVLFRDKGKKVLGEVFDVLGQVSDPLYCVRFNSNKEIKEKGIEVGQIVYVAPRTEHTQFVVLANLMKVRGSDASWENDVEPPPRFIDYSDDEEERSAKRPNRKRQSSGGVTYAGRGTYTPRRPYRGNYIGRGGVRQPHHQPQGNYNIAGNSWHSNFYQPPMYNRPQYQMPGHSPGGYSRSNFNNTPYQHAPTVNPGLVINPYAVYPPPQAMQQPLFPPQHLQQPPPS